ncbi:MAG: histidinol-phosphate transaminase [Armatimonadetes bacterium JP3_11]|nr:MAG: histidinol-phosphate transaminase [Armatimonadetes bacterium JP3_11]RMH08981.1 MAG: histidinol-phosphate transaminase [Armatimonadota bacterium]
MPIRARAHVAQMQPYRPGKTPEQLMQELGLSELIKLSANENPLGASPRAKEAILQHLDTIHLYPDGNCTVLRDALSRFYNLPPDHFAFGNGSDELIHLFGVAYLEAGDELIMAHPSFVRYEASAQLNNAVLKRIPLTQDYRHDLPRMAQAITERTKLLYIANPNNPTGTIVYRDELEQFLERVPDHVLVILDEAYFEYVDHPEYPNGVDSVRAERNVVVFRTFSKAYGLAGLRIGYAIGRPELLDPVERVREPFNVNTLAQVAAAAAITDFEHLERTRAFNRAGLNYLQAACERLGLRFVPSYANFLLIEIGCECVRIQQEILRRGVLVRTGEAFGMPHFLRVNTGTPEQNERFIEALHHALGK